jgi:uncharacterized protein with NRDE domain
MCLVGVAVDAHPAYPLILVGNRDEMHDRPAAAADWWPENHTVFGGRDLTAGGSWLGVNRLGFMAVVTNYPGRDLPPASRASRGNLVRDYLTGQQRPGEFLAALKSEAARYAGFCLILSAPGEAWAMISPAENNPAIQRLAAGVFTVSNAPLQRPWPKATFLQNKIEQSVCARDVDTNHLFRLLAQQDPVITSDAKPDPNAPWYSRTPFVLNSDYGTRASTVVIMQADGHCRFAERRFTRSGKPAGRSEVCFAII